MRVSNTWAPATARPPHVWTQPPLAYLMRPRTSPRPSIAHPPIISLCWAKPPLLSRTQAYADNEAIPEKGSPKKATKPKRGADSMRMLDSMLDSGSYDEGGLASDVLASEEAQAGESTSAVQSQVVMKTRRRKKERSRYSFLPRTEFLLDEVVEQPKVTPLVCYFLYYFQLVSYIAYENIGYLSSSEEADEFVDAIMNDHASVVGGEAYRLITCSFAHTDPWQLFVMLLALYLLGSELEALIGYSAFTAVYFLSILLASSADVISGDFPVTQGASAAIAAMLGAVLAHTIKNWNFELQVEKARQCPSETQSSYDNLTEAEVQAGFETIPFFEDIFKFKAVVSRKSQFILSTTSAVIAGGRSLLDATEMDTYTSFTGLGVGMVSGFVLAWLMSPTYEITREYEQLNKLAVAPPGPAPTTSSETKGSFFASNKGAKAKKPAKSTAGRPMIVVSDTTTVVQKGLVVLVFNCALFYCIKDWVV